MNKGKFIVRYKIKDNDNIMYNCNIKGNEMPIIPILVEIVISSALDNDITKTEFMEKIKKSWDEIKQGRKEE